MLFESFEEWYYLFKKKKGLETDLLWPKYEKKLISVKYFAMTQKDAFRHLNYIQLYYIEHWQFYN